MEYSIPYVLLICFYGFMALWYNATEEEKSRKYNIIICFVVSIVFWGLRGFCFYDFYVYYPSFYYLDISDFSKIDFFDVEPGFTLLMMACKSIYNEYFFFTFVCSCINFVLLGRFLIRHVGNVPFGLVISTSIVGIFLFTDLLRNALSLFIFINAIDYISERKPLKYFLMCTLALSFHYSSIFYFPLYFFLHRKINRWVFLGIFFIGCFVFVFNIPILLNLSIFILSIVSPELENRIQFYLTEVVSTGPMINFVFIERVMTAILVFIYIDKLRSVRENANLYINSVLLFFCMIFFLHEFETLSNRLSYLFACGYWIVWTDLIKCFSIENNRKLFILFLGFYCMLRIFAQNQTIMSRYDNILFDPNSFHERESIYNKNYKD